MKVTELSRDQLIQLKQEYLVSTRDVVTWEDLVWADESVLDEEIMLSCAGMEFTEEDFRK